MTTIPNPFDLRGLSWSIMEIAREHPAYPQVSDIIKVACEAINAVALIGEQRKMIDQLEAKLPLD